MPRPRRTVAPVTDTKTARWLDRALRNTNLHKTLQDAVSRKLPKSAAAGLVEDHIQDGYLRLLEQNALDRHVEDENDAAPSNLRWWMAKSAFKDIRAFGREPILRETLGAKTETDLKREKAGLPPVTPNHLASVEVILNSEGFDIATQSNVVTMELDANDTLGNLRRKLLAAGIGRVGDAIAVVIAMSDGASYAEAAQEVGISTADAKRLMDEVRAVMR